MTQDALRREFEAWATTDGCRNFTRDEQGRYCNGVVGTGWRVWQAVRAAPAQPTDAQLDAMDEMAGEVAIKGPLLRELIAAARLGRAARELRDENAQLRATVERLTREREKYRLAVIDLADRGYGVRRPQWLVATIDAARAGEGK